MWFQRVGFVFSRATCISSVIFLRLYGHVRARASTSRGFIIFFFSGSCSQETSTYVVPYDTSRSFVVFWGTILRPIKNSDRLQELTVDPKMHHPAKRSLAMCENTGVPRVRDFIVVIHRYICCEHSLIRRRNCLMTEAANSLSAAAGPELSTTRNPIANLASDSATAGLAWVRVCVLWRPGASVRRTQAER